MATAKLVHFSLKVVMLKDSQKVLYAEVGSDFADVLFSFLTLPLGTIVRLLNKHHGDNAPVLGSLNSLYAGLKNMDACHFGTEAGKMMLLNPRNASGVQCSRLRLQIDYTPSMQYFICPNHTCVSMYYNIKCLCGNRNSTTGKIAMKDLEIEAQSGEKSVFTANAASFLLTDDLQILPNSSPSFFRILKLNGIEDTSIIEEKTLLVGLKEVMELLTRSLVSKNPITDIILQTSLGDKYEPDSSSSPHTKTSKSTSSGSKKITIRVLVQKSTDRVLLAQTSQDFIDFLFSLLTIPLGRVQFLLGNDTCLGSIHNLYKSVFDLGKVQYMNDIMTSTRLLEPEIPPYYMSCYQILSLDKQNSTALLPIKFNRGQYQLYFYPYSYPSDDPVMKLIDPKGQSSFLKGPNMFTVTDDLIVSTPPSTSIMITLNKIKFLHLTSRNNSLKLVWKRLQA